MDAITIRLAEDTLESLDNEADEHGRTRSEHIIRNRLQTRDEHERIPAQYEETLSEYEAWIDELEDKRDRLQRRLIATNQRVDEHQELVWYVEDQREVERYRARRERMLDEANILTRWKWKITGVPVDGERTAPDHK